MSRSDGGGRASLRAAAFIPARRDAGPPGNASQHLHRRQHEPLKGSGALGGVLQRVGVAEVFG